MLNKLKTLLAVAALSGAALLGSQSAAQAAGITLQPLNTIASQAEAAGTMVEKVHDRHRRYWRWRCADRWGWHTRKWRRCMRRNVWRHRHDDDDGYGRGYRYCKKWRHRCADRWDWNTRGYRRCMRKRDCY